jgi:hypothetical protein
VSFSLNNDSVLYNIYYTSDIRRDPVWIVGMLDPPSARMARVPMGLLEAAI